MISLATLAFTIGNEWWRGRRIEVSVSEATIENTLVYEVTVKNKGTISVSVIGWGYVFTAGRGPGRDRRRLNPGDTGIAGPQFPYTLPGGQQVNLNATAETVRIKANEEPAKKRMPAYIEISSSHRRRYSVAIKLT